MIQDPLSKTVIGGAIAVHRELGPGLLESVYETCLLRELLMRGLHVARQVRLPVRYRGEVVSGAFRVDLLVEDALIIEVKAVESLLEIHRAQLLTYLKLSGIRRGLVINFNVLRLSTGISRVIL